MKKIFLVSSIVFVGLASCKKENTTSTPEPTTQNAIAQVDSKVNSFLTAYNVPGASIAITQNGKLVYAKGYGFSNQSANEKVNTNNKFRVASVSKTITAVAIHKLIQEGKLGIDDKVFGTAALLGNTYGNATAYSNNVKAITVRQLLQHTAGWRNIWPGDPAYQNPTMNIGQLIGWALDNVPVTATPGTQSQYSNFCYLVLGRIIEKVSNKTYEQCIQQDVLTPLGAVNTQVSGITVAERKPNEVVYYGQGAEINNVYTDPWTRMDAAGGLITTPTDLVRMLCAIDSFTTKPDILNLSALQLLTRTTTATPNNGCGFYVNTDPVLGSQWYHYGSLPGCQAVVYRNSKGCNLAFTINTRHTNGNAALNAMGIMIDNILKDQTITWQNIDQF